MTLIWRWKVKKTVRIIIYGKQIMLREWNKNTSNETKNKKKHKL